MSAVSLNRSVKYITVHTVCDNVYGVELACPVDVDHLNAAFDGAKRFVAMYTPKGAVFIPVDKLDFIEAGNVPFDLPDYGIQLEPLERAGPLEKPENVRFDPAMTD
jgi:hypothetical protein